MKTSVKLGLVTLTLALAAGAAFFWFEDGANLAELEHLQQPRFMTMPDQRMLVVEATGDPNVVAGPAFEVLFKAYYALDGVSRFGRPPAPRARWANLLDTPRTEWMGRYALPVPDDAASTAIPRTESGMRLAFETWSYGQVAEILHVGPYSNEGDDIERLMYFVDSCGYGVTGEHEEEYVKGPGMFFKGDPAKYLTVIRLRVRK